MKKPKSKRSKLIKECDRLLSRILKIRRGFRCERCGKEAKPRGLHAHHLLKKGHYGGLRYDEDNIVILCYHCHRFKAHSSDIETLQEFNKWVEEHLGRVKFTHLKQRGAKAKPIKTYMLEGLRDYLKMELKELEANPG